MDLEVDLLLMVCALVCCLCGSNQHRCAPCVSVRENESVVGVPCTRHAAIVVLNCNSVA